MPSAATLTLSTAVGRTLPASADGSAEAAPGRTAVIAPQIMAALRAARRRLVALVLVLVLRFAFVFSFAFTVIFLPGRDSTRFLLRFPTGGTHACNHGGAVGSRRGFGQTEFGRAQAESRSAAFQPWRRSTSAMSGAR
ncbi:hypothetical protein GCM10010387_03730 [Streptomyces inusitatus]|uniref:Uncharacterized protein n=1 Tax=Streptomyces inusitatus TaxID=68221 RepID=A0A918UJN7_9ACTN|nr:hypothetical protein GCM10010387_03730 [Streptomyces inusitatus]